MLQANVIDTSDLFGFLTSSGFLSPSWDLFIIGFFFLISLAFGLSLGRDRIIVILVSIYMSVAVITYVPYITQFTASININDGFALRISAFLGIFILVFFLLSQFALMKTLAAAAEQGAWWQSILFSILNAGLLTSVVLSFFPAEGMDLLTGFTRQIFLSDLAKAIWIIAPVFAMLLVGKTNNKR